MTPPAERGFGTTLIERSLKYEFGAEVAFAFRPEGVQFEAMLPLVEA